MNGVPSCDQHHGATDNHLRRSTASTIRHKYYDLERVPSSVLEYTSMFQIITCLTLGVVHRGMCVGFTSLAFHGCPWNS